MSSGFFAALNGAIYYLHSKYKKAIDLEKDKDFQVDYFEYLTNRDRAKKYLNEPSKSHAFHQIDKHERENNGLVILEAYFGLPEHIYDIHSGLVLFTEPQTADEYNRCQVIPVAKQLQLLVKNSSLTLSKDMLYKKRKKKEEKKGEKKKEEDKTEEEKEAEAKEKQDPDNPEHVDYSKMINGIFNPTVKGYSG